MTDEDKKNLQEILRKVKNNVRITKVVCTRSVKGRQGDHYVGFSAAWDTIQDDAGGAADILSSQDENDPIQKNGMTLRESRIAALVIAMQADIAAHDHAAAGGNISNEQHKNAVRAIKANYTNLLLDMINNRNGNGQA